LNPTTGQQLELKRESVRLMQGRDQPLHRGHSRPPRANYNMRDRAEFVVLGAGVAGLAAASDLADAAIVLEESRNRAVSSNHRRLLVRSSFIFSISGRIHGARLRALLGDDLAPEHGSVRGPTRRRAFSIQLHLSGLERDASCNA
jgi:glycine/D-amino acid oxidase-like deaminating enzyme